MAGLEGHIRSEPLRPGDPPPTPGLSESRDARSKTRPRFPQLVDNLKTSLTDPAITEKTMMAGTSSQAYRHLLTAKSYRLDSDMVKLRRDIASETLMALEMAADLHLGN